MHTPSFTTVAISLLSLFSTIKALPIASPAGTPPPPPKKEGWGDWKAGFPSQAVLPQDFPDPSFVKASDGWYAFATSNKGRNIQVAKSPSFSEPAWSLLPIDALPDTGPWTDHSQRIWAPSVAQTTSGTWVMYYAAPPSADVNKHCISTAVAQQVTGPYIPSPVPFVCDIPAGGSIDASYFKDPKSGKAYVTYKVDGNSLGGDSNPTPIMIQQVNAADGFTKIGNPVRILDQDPNSEDDGPLVEAPTMLYHDGVYFLLFSTNYYNTDAYDIRYVTSSSLTGPFSKQQTTLMKTGDGNGVRAPGSCDTKDGMIMFHGTVVQEPLERHLYAGYLSAQGNVLKYSGSV